MSRDGGGGQNWRNGCNYGLDQHRRVTPAETDIRMMAFGFGKFTDFQHEGFSEVPKPEGALDPVCFVHKRPLRCLPPQLLGLLSAKWRHTPTAGRAGLLR